MAVYSTFLQRGYDQLIEDIALQQVPVVLCLDRAGISGEDGVTHQGIFDIVYLRGIPNLTVMAASSGEELEGMLEFGVGLGRPCAIRYPKSSTCPERSRGVVTRPSSLVTLGKAEILREGKDAALIALGAMVGPALEAAEALKKENISLCVVNARFIKPLDRELFLDLAGRFKYLITIEDGILDAGFGSAVQELVNRPLLRLGLPCEFIEHGSRARLLEKYGLDVKGIVQSLRNAIH